MKAVVKLERTPNSAEILSWPDPVISSPTEVIVAVECAAVCGSDLHAYEYLPTYHWMNVPVVLGHEFSGKVVEAGSAACVRVGDRVMGESNLTCGHCHNCRQGKTHICLNNRMRGLHIDGVMSEYVLIEDRYLHLVPESVSSAEAAAAQACTVSTHALCDRSKLKPCDIVVVMGPGIVGLAAAQLARLKGAAKVIVSGRDSDAHSRLKLARQLGFETINVDKEDLRDGYKKIVGNRLADVIVECSGSPRAIMSSLAILQKGGELLFVGIPPKMEFPFSDAVRNEWNLVMSYTSSWKNYEDTLSLIAEKKLVIQSLLKMYDFDYAEQAFLDALSQKVAKPVLILP